jgi:hypothetical protein
VSSASLRDSRVAAVTRGMGHGKWPAEFGPGANEAELGGEKKRRARPGLGA